MLLGKVVPLYLRACRHLYVGSTLRSPDRNALNRSIRIRLAAAYKGLESHGMNEGINNHLSAIAPASNSDGEIMLILPSHLHSTEATPSNLVEVNEKNEVVAGEGKPNEISLGVHREIYHQRPDARAVIHTHMIYASTLACLKDPKLLMLHQYSTKFHNRIIFDTSFQGIGDTSKAQLFEGDKSGRKDILVVRNHGVYVVADSIDLAFDDVYYLEKAAEMQLLAFSTHQELQLIEEDVAEESCKGLLKLAPDYAKRQLDSLAQRYGFLEESCSK